MWNDPYKGTDAEFHPAVVKERRMRRLLEKIPPEKRNSRLRKAARRFKWWDKMMEERSKHRSVVDAGYAKLDPLIEAADEEWDRNHYWDHATQEWRRKT